MRPIFCAAVLIFAFTSSPAIPSAHALQAVPPDNRPVPTVPSGMHPMPGRVRPTMQPATPAEAHAEIVFEAARSHGPLALHALLEKMPKGADLHMHLSGAVYAETFLKDAADDGMCIDPVKLALVKPAATESACVPGTVPASSLFANLPASQHLYDALVDSFSMRAFVPKAGVDGHDQFFATFARFDGIGKQHLGEWLDEVATRAAAQNVQYLEIMVTPPFGHAAGLGFKLGWPVPTLPMTTAASSTPQLLGASRAELAALRDKLLAAGLRDEVAVDSAEFDTALAQRSNIERCGQPDAAAACSVQIRFLYQVLRAFAPQQVFAQTLLAFEVASADANVVGLNFVQPEDAYMAMSEYHRQMRMLDYLHTVYPHVHITLHAGELAPGLVPPAGLSFHVREAVDLGHAERIGHGVDVMYETDPQLLLKELAARHIMIEVNLTSNDVILGVDANHHSLPSYRAAHVPVALSTDDEGVSRIDLTHEYARAATDFHLSYLDLKAMARTSLEHSFLRGPGLFAETDDFTRIIPVCAGQLTGADTPTPACTEFLRNSPHAAQQWELEHRFKVFESLLP
jgi:adenosine deaminase